VRVVERVTAGEGDDAVDSPSPSLVPPFRERFVQKAILMPQRLVAAGGWDFDVATKNGISIASA